jgi:hypothetical protein
VGWKEITNVGVKRLRKRIEQLDDANLITPSLSDLLELSEGNPKQIDSLRLQSRYGLRRLPLAALFVDLPLAEKDGAMVKWAQDRLDALLTKATPGAQPTQAKNEIKKGISIADELWEKYDTLRLRRHRLSRFAEKATKAILSADENTIYQSDRNYFGVKTINGKEKCEENICTIIEAKKTMSKESDRPLRWAILFTVLNLYARKLAARKHFQARTGFSGDVGGLFADLSVEDVFLALCPSPGEEPWIQKNLSDLCGGFIRKYKCLERPASIHSEPDNYGNLCVKMSHLLAGKKWEQNRATAQDQWTYGLLPGEKCVLRRYALDHQYNLTASDDSPFLKAIFS